MEKTFTQIFIELVFAVKGRQSFIQPGIRETVQKYMATVLQNDGHKMLAIYCMPDHAHLFIGMNPDISLADMCQDVKRASTNFINNNHLLENHFNWQKGYGAFGYSKKQVPSVIEYILHQEQSHKNKTFRQEYHELLDRHQVEYEEKYLFEFYD